MPHLRLLVRVIGLALALVGSGCGDDEREARAAPSSPSPARPGELAAVTAQAGDPLLERARQAMREGALPAEVQAQVLESSAPAHARARRVLLAMAEPLAEGTRPAEARPESRHADADADGREAGRDEGTRPPPLLPPADPSRVPPPLDPAPPKSTDGARRDASTSSRPAPASSRSGASLGRLALRPSKAGATLVIAAPSSLVVGVANQPASGLVRLVIESAKAGDAVLHARPKVEGAAVTEVRQGQGTVQITVRLEPGWSFGSVQPFSGGAKVHLRAPP